jgi:hypothetical protein
VQESKARALKGKERKREEFCLGNVGGERGQSFNIWSVKNLAKTLNPIKTHFFLFTAFLSLHRLSGDLAGIYRRESSLTFKQTTPIFFFQFKIHPLFHFFKSLIFFLFAELI